MTRFYFALPLVVLLLGTAGCRDAGPAPPPEPAATREGRWVQDIDYVCDNLARLHEDAFRNTSREAYQAARLELIGQVPGLPDATIAVRLAAIVALLGDAHTNLPLPLGGPLFPLAPCVVDRTSEGFFLLGVPADRAPLLEGRVVGVGGVALDEALRRLGTVISHENEVGVLAGASELLRAPAVLHALGLAERPDSVRLEVETAEGVQSVDFAVPRPGAEPALVLVQASSTPLTSQRRDENYWYRTLPDQGVLYLAYNACYEDERYPFEAFAAQVLTELERPDIRRLVIDLRNNQGGSELVARPLLERLKGHRLDHPGGIIVLIGAHTFSSAKGTALSLRASTHAVLIGNPTRQRPNSFGEVKAFKSPNFGLSVGYSTKYFERGPETETAVRPDVEVPFTLAEWKRGVDPIFEAALTYEP